MKQAQNARKGRPRTSSRKNNGKSNGPGNPRQEYKVRGNPKQLLEKYKTQAREAMQAGDRVQAEYYHQFADHYQRVLNEMRGPGNAYVPDDEDFDEGQGEGEGNAADDLDAQQQDQRQQQPQQSQQRQGRNRGRRGRQNEAEGDTQSDNIGNVDRAETEQPIEVHPELDLMGTPAAEGEDKPRRRAPRGTGNGRRARPRKPESEGGETTPDLTPPQDGEAA